VNVGSGMSLVKSVAKFQSIQQRITDFSFPLPLPVLSWEDEVQDKTLALKAPILL